MSGLSTNWRQAFAAFAAVLALGACASQPTPQQPRVYTERGPNDVGVLTLSLSDRKVEVYYPAAAGAAKGRVNEVYLQTDPVPPMLAGMLKKIPETVDLVFGGVAFRDAPAAHGKAFPLVIFSHGWRLAQRLWQPPSGIASWGFVVALVDFTEYGFASPTPRASWLYFAPRIKHDRADAALDLMARTTADAQSPLAGLIDMSSVRSGRAFLPVAGLFGAIDNPRIDVR